jgi:hypothetical protein
VGLVANTQGRGVRVRVSPGGLALTAWFEGTRVTLVDADSELVNGLEWLHVRNELGVEGWIAAEYCQRVVKEVK